MEDSSFDMNYLVGILSEVKVKGARTDFIDSAIAQHSSKLLQEDDSSLGTATASWMKKRLFVETLIGILPPEKDSVSCNFLLRLLRVANMVDAESDRRDVIEKRISSQLDHASLKELMIPSFKHTCKTLFDVQLALKLFTMFSDGEDASKSVAPLIKVSKLQDCYLAEVSTDSNLEPSLFSRLCRSLPTHARTTDDGLYKAVISYLKAHPGLSKQEKMLVCEAIDFGKLSDDAARHSVFNSWLPVRCVMQILYKEQTRVLKKMEWRAFSSTRRNPYEEKICHTNLEMRKLREEVGRLQRQCHVLEARLDKIEGEKRGNLWWKKLKIIPLFSKSAGEYLDPASKTEER